MIKFFPDGDTYEEPCYWANHHFSMLLACGCTVGDAEFASAPALAVANAGRAKAGPGKMGASDEYQRAFAKGYLAAAARLEAQAEQDLASGRGCSAGGKLLRASILYELLDWNYWPYGRMDADDAGTFLRRGRAAFKRGLEHAGGPHAGISWTTVPFEGQALEAMFVPARRADGSIMTDPAPVVLHVNGMHSSLQWQYSFGIPAALAERGIASFHYDHPGTGKARYEQGLKSRPDSESYGRAAIDHLVSRPDVDADRIGIIGGSFGSYRGPRIASFDHRVKSVVAWSTQYDMSADFPDVIDRLLGEGEFTPAEQPVLDALFYWTGATDVATLREQFAAWTLSGRMEHVTAALLCVLGDKDMMPRSMAERMLREATASPRAELVMTTADTGGQEHCHWDEPAYARQVMVDFTAEVLGGRLSV